MTMKKVSCSILCLSLVLGMLLPDCLAASVEHDAEIPQLVFAAQELKRAIAETGRNELTVTLTLEPDDASPEAF
jgi:hypothetical protein